MEAIERAVMVFQRILTNLVEIQQIAVADHEVRELLRLSLQAEQDVEAVCRRVGE